MYRRILVPIDLADVELAKPAIATALMMAKESNGSIRLVNVLPMTPVMLAEYVPPDSHRTGVRTYFLGSNAGHVVRYAACSVLVVRQRAN